MKTLDVNAKEWFDKVNGNSYFSAVVTIDYGMDSEKSFTLPFQYGYGEHYLEMAKETLIKEGIVKFDENVPLWSYCRDNGIILRKTKQENCRKKDL